MDTTAVLNAIHSMLVNFYYQHNVEPTHVLVDPRLYRELMMTGDTFGPLNYRDRTAFGLAFIEVYKPYPFLSVAALTIHQQ